MKFWHSFVYMFVLLIVTLPHQVSSQVNEENYSYLILRSSPDGAILAGVGRNGIAHILDSNTGQVQVDISVTGASIILAVEWSPDGKHLALADFDGTIRIFCTDTTNQPDCVFGDEIASWDGQSANILDLDWSPDGTKIVTAGQDTERSISIWDVATQQLVGFVAGLGPIDVDWSPDGRWIAFANVDLGVGYFDVNTISLTGMDSTSYPVGSIKDATAVAWNSNSTQLAVAQGSIVYPDQVPISITVWDITQSESIVTFTGHTRTVEDIVWSTDDNYLASVGFEADVITWDITSGSMINHYRNPLNGMVSIYGITWVGDTHQIAYGGTQSEPPTITEALLPVVADFSLINGELGTEIGLLNDGDVIDLDAVETSSLFIKARTLPFDTGGVVFDLNSAPAVQTDDTAPYELTNWTATPGQYTLTATPYSGSGGAGTAGIPLTINFTVVDSSTACAATIPASDTAALISVITTANGAGTPQTLCLMDSTYTLDTAPTITGDITIVGDGATIIFADGGGFEVAEGGTLTLLYVTVISAA